jgi:two-component system chemotaxis response regulator CheB
VRALPADFPAPIFVVQHTAADSPSVLPQILNRAGPLRAAHPRDGEVPQAGRIYVAPPDFHMLIERGCVRLSDGPRENHSRPAIDPLFRSAALAYGPGAIGVVLTGMLDDGSAGLLAIKEAGGTAIVQDPRDAAAPSMPESAMQRVQVDYCLPLAGIAPVLVELVRAGRADGLHSNEAPPVPATRGRSCG